jgi:hypothetical protein
MLTSERQVLIMKLSNRLTTACLPAILLVLPLTVVSQWQKKPYTEWSEKEVLAVLNNSPWGQTQTATDTSKMFDVGRALDSSQSRVAEVSQTNFRIRFFSAKPIREAFSRLVELKQKGKVSPDLAAKLKALAGADFPDYIVVTVVSEYAEARSRMGLAATILERQSTPRLKNQTYLSVNSGQRLFLLEYQAPRNDGFGARFIFPRLVDGKPFITDESGDVLFHADLVDGPALDMRFKLKDMMFDGKLEY